MRPLDAERVASALPRSSALPWRLEVLEACASSSDELRQRLGRSGAAACHGLVLVAESQQAGRGRKARDWWTGPPGANLAFSLCLQPPVDPPEASGLLAACALAEAAEQACAAAEGPGAAGEVAASPPALALKWPNDLLAGGAKLGGLLAEVPSSAPPAVMIGVGLNLAAAPPAGTCPYPVRCLEELAGAPIEREALLAAVLAGLARRWAAYLADGPAQLETEFLQRLRAWAPHGVRARGSGPPAAGPLIEFSVRDGLTWGREGHEVTRAAGLLPELEALTCPGS